MEKRSGSPIFYELSCEQAAMRPAGEYCFLGTNNHFWNSTRQFTLSGPIPSFVERTMCIRKRFLATNLKTKDEQKCSDDCDG